MASLYDDAPTDLRGIRARPLAGRPAKVSVRDFAREPQAGCDVAAWLESLPDILAGKSLKEFVSVMRAARGARKPIIWGVGGHVVKCGLAPVLIGLMRRGFLTALVMNGSAAIHDAEIALCGSTSEEVSDVLADGSFGMAAETVALLQAAGETAAREQIGLGEALGRELAAGGADSEFAGASLLAAACGARVPVTVHVAVGTDTPHMHPQLDVGMQAAASHHDFRLLCTLVSRLDGGGVYLNVGSAVLLPEVFLKAVTVTRNLGRSLQNFSAANFDFIQHYRPTQNVLLRPTAAGGRSFAFTGHHEIMIPLLAALLAAQ